MKIRGSLIAIVAATTLVLSPYHVTAQDQQPASLKNVLLSVYPEYDDRPQLGYPSVLVMYEGEFVSDNIPATFRFMVPSNALLNAAAYLGPQNQYLEGHPNRSPSNITGWDEVSFEIQSKYFLVEYYAPVFGQPDRTISYDFRTLYPINGLGAVIQEPKRSTNFMVSPEGSISTGEKGFRYHTYNYANITSDAPLHFDISYTKKDLKPSLGGGISSTTTVFLVVSGVIIVLTGVFLIFLRLKSPFRPSGIRSSRRRAARVSGRKQIPSENKFCRACGKEIKESDRFCAYCGEKLG